MGNPSAVLERAHGSLRLTVQYDDDPHPDNNPRTWDSKIGVLFTPHSRYTLGDDDVPADIRRAFDHYAGRGRHGRGAEMFARYLRVYHGATVVLPVGLIDHSGLSMYVGGGAHLSDPGGWDSGTIGFTWDTPADRAEIGPTATPERMRESLVAEVETYDQWLRGDIYGYVIERVVRCDHGAEHRETLESLWGMFGQDYAEAEALAVWERYVADEPTTEP